MMIHQHAKFGYKWLSSSEDIFQTKPGHTDMNLPLYPPPPTPPPHYREYYITNTEGRYTAWQTSLQGEYYITNTERRCTAWQTSLHYLRGGGGGGLYNKHRREMYFTRITRDAATETQMPTITITWHSSKDKGDKFHQGHCTLHKYSVAQNRTLWALQRSLSEFQLFF